MDTHEIASATQHRCLAASKAVQPNRRQVLRVCSGCAVACATLSRSVLAAYGDPIPAGALSDYTKDEISEKYIQHNFFMTRHQGRLFATVATCPHQENYLIRNTKDPTIITCTGHDAVFDARGKPIRGPVREGLVRFGIAVDDRGIVLVDPNKRFPEARWNSQGSFLLVGKVDDPVDDIPEPRGKPVETGPAEPSPKPPPSLRKDALRNWTDASGQYEVKAYLVSYADGRVKLRRADNGKLVEVPLDRLSSEDQNWLQALTP